MHIPAELKNRNQWVCYRLEPDPGGSKPKKVPVDPVTGKRMETYRGRYLTGSSPLFLIIFESILIISFVLKYK